MKYRHDFTDVPVRVLEGLQFHPRSDVSRVRVQTDLHETADRDLFLGRELDESADSVLFVPDRVCADAVDVWKGRSFGAYDPHGRLPAGKCCFAEYADRLLRRYASPSSFHHAAMRYTQYMTASALHWHSVGKLEMVHESEADWLREEDDYLRGLLGLELSESDKNQGVLF